MSEFSQQFFRTRLSGAQHAAQITLAFSAALALAGCGSNLRPTVTPITGTGPGAQPTAYAFVISNPSPTTADPIPNGIGTVIDYSGDTIMATASIGPNPITFTLNGAGGSAWSLNEDGTVSNIPVSTSLQAKNVFYSTLNPIPTSGPFANQDPVVALFAGGFGLYALDDNLNEVDVLSGFPDAFKLVVPVDQTPVTMVGVAGSTRYYTISQDIPYSAACNNDSHLVTATGLADDIETASYSLPSAHIQLGICPVYAVGTPDTKRVFVLNRGSDTISVINSQNNTLDSCTPGVNQNGQAYTCHQCLPLSIGAITPSTSPLALTDPNYCAAPPNGSAGMNGAGSLPANAGPVYAEYNSATGLLVVANYEGNTISIIDVSLDEYGNDSATFGTTYTVPVGMTPGVGSNPAAVTVLADGSRAYTANQSDGSVSIVTLSSHSLEKTLPVTGNPRTVVSTQNSIYGKVYVVAPNSPYVTIVRVDQDIIDTTVLVQGNAIDARITSPDGSTSNTNLISRLPGAGQPCFLPLGQLPAADITIANCKYQDVSLLTDAK